MSETRYCVLCHEDVWFGAYGTTKDHVNFSPNECYESREKVCKDCIEILTKLPICYLEKNDCGCHPFDEPVKQQILENQEKAEKSHDMELGLYTECNCDPCWISRSEEKRTSKIIEEIVEKNQEIIINQKERAVGPLMGIAMKKLRGKASGEIVNKLLLKNIRKKLASI